MSIRQEKNLLPNSFFPCRVDLFSEAGLVCWKANRKLRMLSPLHKVAGNLPSICPLNSAYKDLSHWYIPHTLLTSCHAYLKSQQKQASDCFDLLAKEGPWDVDKLIKECGINKLFMYQITIKRMSRSFHSHCISPVQFFFHTYSNR